MTSTDQSTVMLLIGDNPILRRGGMLNLAGNLEGCLPTLRSLFLVDLWRRYVNNLRLEDDVFRSLPLILFRSDLRGMRDQDGYTSNMNPTKSAEWHWHEGSKGREAEALKR